MLAKKLPAFFLFFSILFFCAAARAQAGKPVHSLSVSIVPDKNIVKVMWDHQEGVAEYSVERWEAR